MPRGQDVRRRVCGHVEVAHYHSCLAKSDGFARLGSQVMRRYVFGAVDQVSTRKRRMDYRD